MVPKGTALQTPKVKNWSFGRVRGHAHSLFVNLLHRDVEAFGNVFHRLAVGRNDAHALGDRFGGDRMIPRNHDHLGHKRGERLGDGKDLGRAIRCHHDPLEHGRRWPWFVLMESSCSLAQRHDGPRRVSLVALHSS